jgi:hypothetical protein
VAKQRLMAQAIERIATAIDGPIIGYARERAAALGRDHVSVEPVFPADVIGVYVLVPAG